MKKILIVDDDTDILALVQMTLTMNDFDVMAISRWQETDESIARFNPDLILLDISLTGADGRDICKRIKQAKETGHIAVVLFSANTHLVHNIQDCMAQAMIEKPYELTHLLKTIRQFAG